MKELELIKVISSEIGHEYIGDDCAYLKELGIVVTQDNLTEGIHFKREWYTPFLLGYKSAAVNISDVLASGAEPAYLSVALSIPNDINESFIKEFYKGIKSVSNSIKVIGGDITGSKSGITISITAIGKTEGRNIASRKFAKPDYAVITNGEHGGSSTGLKQLLSGIIANSEFINIHLKPELDFEFSKQISTTIQTDYAMMDSSDGLCDALFKIAEASNVSIDINYNSIPKLDGVKKEQVLFGGEDYKLIACVPKHYLQILKGYTKIGNVLPFDSYRVKIDDLVIKNYADMSIFNHFRN